MSSRGEACRHGHLPSRYRQRSWCRAVCRLRMTGATEVTGLSAANDFYSCILSWSSRRPHSLLCSTGSSRVSRRFRASLGAPGWRSPGRAPALPSLAEPCRPRAGRRPEQDRGGLRPQRGAQRGRHPGRPRTARPPDLPEQGERARGTLRPRRRGTWDAPNARTRDAASRFGP